MNFMNDNIRKKINSLSIEIPYKFIREKVNMLTWRELHYGVFAGYTPKQTAIEYAVSTINPEEDPKSLHFQLASLYRSEDYLVDNLLTQIIKEEPFQSENEIKRKWLYLIIFWLYLNQETPIFLDEDPRGPIEDLFGVLLVLFGNLEYPIELANIIGYTDDMDDSIGYIEEMKNYLDVAEKIFNQ